MEKFPFQKTFTDCAGVTHEFLISCNFVKEVGMFTVSADEILDNKKPGYSFGSFKTNIPHALADLFHKITKRLATKYLSDSPIQPHLTFDEAVGQIGYGGVIIDGDFLTFEQFCRVLQQYEGFLFELKIKDLSEE